MLQLARRHAGYVMGRMVCQEVIQNRAEPVDIGRGSNLAPEILLGTREIGGQDDRLSLLVAPGSIAFATPKSRSFGEPSGVTTTLEGFRSR